MSSTNNNNSSGNHNNTTINNPKVNVYSNIPNSTTYTYGSGGGGSSLSGNSTNNNNTNNNTNNNNNNSSGDNKNHSPVTSATDRLTKMDIEEKWDNKNYEKDEREKSPLFHILASNLNSFGNFKVPSTFSLTPPEPNKQPQQQNNQPQPQPQPQPQQQQQQNNQLQQQLQQQNQLQQQKQQQQHLHQDGIVNTPSTTQTSTTTTTTTTTTNPHTSGLSLQHAHSSYTPSNVLHSPTHFQSSLPTRLDTNPITTPIRQQQQQQQSQQQLQQIPPPTVNSFFLPPPVNARERLKEFKQIRVIGTGTFGKVYLIQNTKDGCYYAMKCLNKAYVVQLKQVEHLNSEKSILSSIHHPFIVNLYQAFQDEKKLYLLFEYVAGGEVFTHLRKSMKFSNSTAKFYAAEIVLALEFLHKQNIVYRDLKPENLLIDNQGHIKITDFGFAKRVEDRTFTLCGTPEYLAPEIIQSKGHGKAVDWWALGILIFEMLAGYPPFYDDDTFAIYNKILAGRITFPLGFDVDAKDLIKRLLTADRTRRLGALRDGALDVKNHRWFSDINWERLYQRRDNGPFIPKIQHQGDSSNFEMYDEEEMVEEPPSSNYVDPYAHLFKDF
ncbi:hypothetical protein ACTFIW_001654 [Dictyostelium discoideum]